MTSDWFEGRAQPIMSYFVVTRKDGDLSFILHPDLGRTDQMACGMQADLYVIDVRDLPIFLTYDRYIGRDPVLNNGCGVVMAKVVFHARPGMIRMAMGYNG